MSILFLACMMAIAVHANQAAASLNDIPDKYGKEIHYLLEQGVINGYPDGTFGPKLNVSREEAVKMVASAIGLDGTPRTTSFQDVLAKSWSSGYIQSAYEAGLLSSIAGETFRPQDKMTRGEMAFLLQQTFKLEEKVGDITISDISSSGALYEAINALVAAGLSNGYPDGTFKPDNQVTREEFALFVARGLNEEFRVAPEQGPENEEQPQSQPGEKNETDPVQPPSQDGEKEESVDQEQPETEAPSEDPSQNENQTPNDDPAQDENLIPSEDQIQDNNQNPSNEPAEPEQDLSKNEAVVNATVLHVRSTPTAETNENIIGSLIAGDVVLIEFTEGIWVYIHGDRVSGYVHRSYLSTSAGQPLEPISPGGKLIVLDPGHGGKDPGAVANGIREKDINLSVALKVEKILKDKGFTVVKTRKDDTFLELKERVNFAVRNNADIFVSIHANNFKDSSVNGTETYYSKTGPTERANQSKQMAGFIQERLYKALGTKDRGVKDAEFVVIHTNPIPSTLIELGFLSNQGDAAKLASSDYQNKAAQAIADGIVEYYNWRK